MLQYLIGWRIYWQWEVAAAPGKYKKTGDLLFVKVVERSVRENVASNEPKLVSSRSVASSCCSMLMKLFIPPLPA
jgi:hypothetical protein